MYRSAFMGSLVGAGLNVFAVWAYCISFGDSGEVELNPKLLAIIFGCKEEEVQSAIDFLCAPDPHSRNPENEGRRLIKRGEFSYDIPNMARYKAMFDKEVKREYFRNWQRQHRKELNKSFDEAPQAKQVEFTIIQPTSDEVSYPKQEIETARAWKPTELQLRFNSFFNRRPTTPWSDKEIHAFKAIGPIDIGDWELIERYYKAEIPQEVDYRRRDLLTLLNNFRGEVDRARRFDPANIRVHIAPIDKLVMQKELERCEMRIKSILSSYDSHQSISIEDAQKLVPLRKLRNELKMKLGCKV